jgi:hypothetical protein
VLPADIKALIARLDSGSFTTFVEALVVAEAMRLEMSPDRIVISDALTDNDEGLDGELTDVPPGPPSGPLSAIPAGLVGLQFKATKRKTPSAFGLDEELAKPGPLKVLAAGGTYVLVSSQDLNPLQRGKLLAELQEKANDAHPDSAVAIWDAGTLAGLCQIHPAAVAAIGLPDFGAALSLPELLETVLRADEREFELDEPRDLAMRRIRERAADGGDALLMSLFGDPGAGKTRVVAEALNTDELRDSTLYVSGADDIQVLLTRLVRNEQSRGILFIDEVDEHDVAAVVSRVSGLTGRWRIVSVSSRSDRRWIAQGGRNVVLPPLAPDAMQRLVEQHSGLPEAEARMVAEVASGFPELAFRLAEELRADSDLDLVRLARLPHPQEILKRALGDTEARTHLAPLALFSGVGFDDDLRYQVEGVAAAFDLDVDVMILHAESELGRFVSRANRYRLISPLLVAVWLATDLIERTPNFADKVLSLPAPLQDAFMRQLNFFGPDVPHLPDALARAILDDRFRSADSFDEAAGRLLRASAAIIPTQVAEAIGSILTTATQSQLKTLPRRDLVTTLEILLWWEETWLSAIEGLYTLALEENETWSNNATGQFAQAFAVFLSGTTVPYLNRAKWLQTKVDGASPDELKLIARAAAAGLRSHHSRTMTGFRGGGAPRDWQPQTDEEYIESRRAAWRLLLEIRDKSTPVEQATVTNDLAHSLRLAFASALSETIDDELRKRSWSWTERAELSAGLRDVLQYERDHLSDELLTAVLALHDWLVGDELSDRLEVLLRSTTWDLHTSSETIHDTPPLLTELAERVVSDEGGIELALRVGQDIEDQQTRFALFRSVAERVGAKTLGETALAAVEWTATSAALSTADASGDAEWATEVLVAVSQSDDVQRTPDLLRFVDLTPERLDIVLGLIADGRASAEALWQLLYGARIRELDVNAATRLIDIVAESGRVEAALGMLDQWIDVNPEATEDVRALAGQLTIAALTSTGTTMNDFYVEKLLNMNVLEKDTIVEAWRARMENRSGLVEAVDVALTERALVADAGAYGRYVYEMIERQASGETSFGTYASSDLALLSRLAACTSAESVWAELEHLPNDRMYWALHHMNWRGDEPDPLVRLFLTSPRLADLPSEAMAQFANTVGVVAGPYHLALERERGRARRWRDSLAGTDAEAWAERLAAGFEADIAWHRAREAEDDLHFS